jgi:starch synthase
LFPLPRPAGLADVVGALPIFCAALGHDVIVVMPRYAQHQLRRKFGLRRFWDSMGVWMGNSAGVVRRGCGRHEGVPVYFIEYNEVLWRSGLYHDEALNDFWTTPIALAS